MVPLCVVALKTQWEFCARVMSITTGWGRGKRRARSRLPSVQAVSEVKVGKTRVLSMRSSSSSSRGGRGISVAIFWVVLLFLLGVFLRLFLGRGWERLFCVCGSYGSYSCFCEVDVVNTT